ncbi:MAG: methyltransferase [Gammaproteobacteria bacterium RIFCSPHIGHO2_12_FULL_42_10]|nr:MAG: methyltransferase [Gammaproteobacteria bacterium RIFCSPHIGHO2_12_FULL_42_10]
MFRKILDQHNVTTTAALAIFWKDVAKSKANWGQLCVQQGGREKDLFKDEYMSLFVDDAVTAEGQIKLNEKMWLPLATRTRFFRRTISYFVKAENHVKQVILLGGGLDTLSVRKVKYTRDHDVKFFEVDQAELLLAKAELYKTHKMDKNAEYIGIDYVKNDLIRYFREYNVEPDLPTLILWEGNTFYLEKVDALRILKEVTEYFKHLVLTFDYMHASMQQKTQELDSAAREQSLTQTLSQFKANRSPFKTFFEPDEIIECCQQLGLKIVAHKSAADLAKEYDVDREPYYTAYPYSMLTCCSPTLEPSPQKDVYDAHRYVKF